MKPLQIEEVTRKGRRSIKIKRKRERKADDDRTRYDMIGTMDTFDEFVPGELRARLTDAEYGYLDEFFMVWNRANAEHRMRRRLDDIPVTFRNIQGTLDYFWDTASKTDIKSWATTLFWGVDDIERTLRDKGMYRGNCSSKFNSPIEDLRREAKADADNYRKKFRKLDEELLDQHCLVGTRDGEIEIYKKRLEESEMLRKQLEDQLSSATKQISEFKNTQE